MPNTTRGYPTPVASDVPDVPTDLLDLATAIDADVAAVATTAAGAIPKSTVTTKGDLVVATGNGALTRRGIGANGEMLMADSAQADGVRWGRDLTSPFENINVSSTTLGIGVFSIDAQTSSVWLFSNNPSGNFILDFRWNLNTTLAAALPIGKSLAVTVMLTQGATPYRPTSFTIDGTAVTPRWQSGVAPTAGNANSIDVYQFAIVRTGTSAYTVLASLTKFA